MQFEISILENFLQPSFLLLIRIFNDILENCREPASRSKNFKEVEKLKENFREFANFDTGIFTYRTFYCSSKETPLTSV